jgi:uncharacterized protein GlcG (DUF336 family)
MLVAGLVAGLVVALAAPLVTGSGLPASSAAAQTPPTELAMQQIDPSGPLTLAEARAIIEGALGETRARGLRMGITVVDEGGHVISQDRMDGTAFGSVIQATGKAFAAAMSGTTTAELAGLRESAPGRYNALQTLYAGQIYLTGGGQPLRVNGRVVGAVGVSGTPGQDDDVANVGIADWQRMRPGAGR